MQIFFAPIQMRDGRKFVPDNSFGTFGFDSDDKGIPWSSLVLGYEGCIGPNRKLFNS